MAINLLSLWANGSHESITQMNVVVQQIYLMLAGQQDCHLKVWMNIALKENPWQCLLLLNWQMNVNDPCGESNVGLFGCLSKGRLELGDN